MQAPGGGNGLSAALCAVFSLPISAARLMPFPIGMDGEAPDALCRRRDPFRVTNVSKTVLIQLVARSALKFILNVARRIAPPDRNAYAIGKTLLGLTPSRPLECIYITQGPPNTAHGSTKCRRCRQYADENVACRRSDISTISRSNIELRVKNWVTLQPVVRSRDEFLPRKSHC